MSGFGKRAALPRQNPKTARRVEADFAASASGGKVRGAVIEAIGSCRLLLPKAAIHAERSE